MNKNLGGIQILNQLIFFIKRTKKAFDEGVVIYQMGKVGSSTIISSLNKLNIPNIQIHSLDNPYDTWFPTKTKGWNPFSIQYVPSYSFSWKIKRILRNKIIKTILNDRLKSKNNKKIKIITLVREPISREISRFFQNLHVLIYHSIYIMRNDNTIHNDLIKLFEIYNNKRSTITYFDIEFRKFLKIDIYDFPFDKNKGYGIIQKKNLEILILKLEKLNELQEIIGKFLELKTFELISSNQAKTKWYGPLYKEFIKNYVPNEDYLNLVYESKYMKHFYSEEEIKKFKNRWLRK